jgi:hypothetical protein
MLDHISTLQYSGLVSKKTKTYKKVVAGGRPVSKLKSNAPYSLNVYRAVSQ